MAAIGRADERAPSDEPAMRTFVVTGASGRTGGAVAAALARRGYRVRGMSRRAVAEPRADGVEMVNGDYDDRTTLAFAFAGADAALIVTDPHEHGPSAERRHGLTLVRALSTARVKHVVYISAARAHSRGGGPRIDGKSEVEWTLARSGLSYTILAPVFYMENFLDAYVLAQLRGGRLALGVPPERVIQLISVADVAHMAVLALLCPQVFGARRIELASDQLAVWQAAEVLSTALGIAIAPACDRPEACPHRAARMLVWHSLAGRTIDVAALRTLYPSVTWRTLRDWVSCQDWRQTAAGVQFRDVLSVTATHPRDLA